LCGVELGLLGRRTMCRAPRTRHSARSTEAPSTEAPSTEALSTEALSTEALSIKHLHVAPGTEARSTEARSTQHLAPSTGTQHVAPSTKHHLVELCVEPEFDDLGQVDGPAPGRLIDLLATAEPVRHD
jgi:hypothetical protein